MVVAEIQATLRGLMAQPAIFVEANFASRADELDTLEFHVSDRLDGLSTVNQSATLRGPRWPAQVGGQAHGSLLP